MRGMEGRRARVLFVDDSSVSLLVAEALLVDAGYDVRTASTMGEFSQRLTSFQPDIILVDVQMPGMSGPQLCHLLKAHPNTAHVPVVLYSSLPRDKLETLARDCGADGFVCKAERHEQLPAQLESLCASLHASS